MISSGVISLIIGMLPAMKITAAVFTQRTREGERKARQTGPA